MLKSLDKALFLTKYGLANGKQQPTYNKRQEIGPDSSSDY